jgi:flagellar biosynthesis protein FlhA
VFPTILLVATLLRLALNVASTRVVMLHGQDGHAAAGKVIQAFGEVVIGGNYVVGIVVFAILMIINFVGDQGCRADLRGERAFHPRRDARQADGHRRRPQRRPDRPEPGQGAPSEVAQEAEFYGSMDGASKFVRGDAIAGLLILFINLIGGMAVGIFQHNMSFAMPARCTPADHR